MDKETLRMQMLAGVITEGQYKAKLEEIEAKEKESLNEHYVAGGIVGIGAINQIPSRAKADYEDAFEYFLSQKYPLNEAENTEAIGDKAEAAVKDEVKAEVDGLDPKVKEQLKAELARLGITANSTVEDVAQEIKPKIEESLNEAEGDTKEKLAKAFSDVGSSLMKSMLVPLIPLVAGQATGTGFVGGVAITAITAGALIALAKALGAEKSMEEGKEVEKDLNEADAIAIKAIDDKIQNDPEFLKKTKEAMAKAEKGDTTDLASLMADFGKILKEDELEEGKEETED